MTELTDTEHETLREAVANSLSDELATWSGYRLLIMADNIEADVAPAVEAILTAHLARIEALRVSMADGRSLTDDARYWRAKFAAMLAAALAAPTPDEVQHVHACASSGYFDHEPSSWCICVCGERFDGRPTEVQP